MLNKCQHFGLACDVKFNPKKSECIVFSRDRKQVNYNLYLDVEIMKWVTSIKHLGNTLMCDLDEGKLGDFIYRVDSLRANFRGVSSDVRMKLFGSYCTCFYGCPAVFGPRKA